MNNKESFISKHLGSIIIAAAMIVAAIIGGLFLLEAEGNKLQNDAVRNNQIEINTDEKILHLSSKDVLSTLHDKSLTDLQINQFVKRNSGMTVRWEGVVKAVKSAYSTGDGDIYLVFYPKYQSRESFPEIIIATFSYDKVAELSSLSEGDLIIVEGDLSFYNSISWVVSLKNTKLIKFTKEK